MRLLEGVLFLGTKGIWESKSLVEMGSFCGIGSWRVEPVLMIGVNVLIGFDIGVKLSGWMMVS